MEENLPTVERAATANVAIPVDIARLVAEHHAAVYRYAYRLAGAECDAEDLTQQTFLAAQLKLDQLRDPEHGRGWLYAILRNSYLKMRRKRSPVAAACLELDIDAIPEDVPEASTVDPERLQTALNELPDEFKVVLLLFYFEGCSYREIAEKLSLPAGTVMSRLSRAKGHLRSRLFDGELHAAPGELHVAAAHGDSMHVAALHHPLGESSRAIRAGG
jgi:RNA polymerase sigma-70 factor (ECF subfamily)